jgi:hypothetical protein
MAPAPSQICKWSNAFKLDEDGIIVGCSKNHEWLLEWWWLHYNMHNEFPVTFVNFGDMSPQAKAWCQRKGTLIPLTHAIESFVVPKESIPPEMADLWEKQVSNLDLWPVRAEFFKKPFACLHSPYRRAIWLDLDCQVCKSIAPLFEYCENSWQMAISKEPPFVREHHEQTGVLIKGEIEYNSGVVVFKQAAPIIEEWAEMCLSANARVRGDQEALSRYMYLQAENLPSFPPIFNWRGNCVVKEELYKEFVIIHWLGVYKEVIKEQINGFKKYAMHFALGGLDTG